jgi:hypothetical protein
MKTNKEKNLEHDVRQQARVRPAPRSYEFKGLEDAMRMWRKSNTDPAASKA